MVGSSLNSSVSTVTATDTDNVSKSAGEASSSGTIVTTTELPKKLGKVSYM